MYPQANLMLVGGYPPLAAFVSPTTLSASGPSSTQTTGAANATFTGGSGSANYLWQLVSGDASVAPVAGTTAMTTFQATGMANSETRSAVWKCRITDPVTGIQKFTPNVEVDVSRDAALTPITCDMSPEGDTVTRAGAGDVVFFFNGLADHTYDFSSFGFTGSGYFINVQTPDAVQFTVTLTAGQTISGTIQFSVFDSATGRSGVSSAFDWHAVST